VGVAYVARDSGGQSDSRGLPDRVRPRKHHLLRPRRTSWPVTGLLDTANLREGVLTPDIFLTINAFVIAAGILAALVEL
jgi:hypothetical protein